MRRWGTGWRRGQVVCRTRCRGYTVRSPSPWMAQRFDHRLAFDSSIGGTTLLAVPITFTAESAQEYSMRWYIFALQFIGLFVLSQAVTAGQPRLAEEIMADTNSFAARIESKLRQDGDEQSTILKSIEQDIEDSSQWRFHPRGRGLLIAIPVKKNLLSTEKYSGEAAIVDLVERLIRQQDLSGRVEVVFIEPASLDCYIRTPRPCGAGVADAATPCNCQ